MVKLCHSLRVQNNRAIVGPGIHIEDKILAGWSEIMEVFMTPAKHMYVGLIHRLPIQSLGSCGLQRDEASQGTDLG